jgi:glycosyltransferase involved in cell wall biosynthesis
MLARRAVRLVRLLPRRLVYGVLGCVLVATLAAVSVTRTWETLTAELGLVSVTLVAVLVDLRGSRRRLRGLGDQLSAFREHRREQQDLQYGLALEVYDQAKALGREFPAGCAALVVRALVEREDVLEAFALLRPDSIATTPVCVLRMLRRALHRRGYLAAALTIAEACAERGTKDDQRALRFLRGEWTVLTGEFSPVVTPADPSTPVPGRILHLVGKSMPDVQAGYTLRTHFIAVAQRAAGLDPRVVTEMGFGDGSDLTVDDITYLRVAGPAAGTLPLDEWLGRHVERVAEIVRAQRPAVLHAASDYQNALTAEAIGREYGIPVVYESRGFWEETWLSRQIQRFSWDYQSIVAKYGVPDFYRLRRDVEDRCRRSADRVVTLADVMVDRIVAGGVRRERIEVVPNAVDVAAFPVVRRDPELAARLGIAKSTVVIGYISSLAEYEGIDTLIRAYAGLSGPLALVIVGDGTEREPLERLATELGLTGVHFTGQVPHDTILAYYSLIDIFVVPRRPVEVCHLVTPLKPFEAFSTGRTVVLSDVRALSRLAQQSGAAELFTAGDAISLADVLRRLLADPERRRELAAAGAAWVRQERTWAANAKLYQRLYDELVAAVPDQRRPDRTGVVSI